MRTLLRGAVVTGLAVALFAPGVAAGAPSRAEELFDHGSREMEAGRFDAGCPAFDQSYRLEPKLGALFEAALCHERWSKPNAAVMRYQTYLALVPGLPSEGQARHAARLLLARAAVERLSPIIPQLEVVLGGRAPDDLEVSLDGALLPVASLARPLRVDPGPHRLEALSRGVVIGVADLTIAAGVTRRVELKLAEQRSPAPRAEAAPTAGVGTIRAPLVAGAAHGSVRHSAGWISGGFGAAALVVGSVAGLSALHERSVVDRECDAHPDATGRKGCSARGYRAVERGRSRAIVTGVSFGVSLLTLTAAGVLLFDGPSEAPSERAGTWDPVLEADARGVWLGITRTW